MTTSTTITACRGSRAVVAVDTSALVAIGLAEGEMEAFDRLIETRTALVGAPTLVETAIVLSTRMPRGYQRFMSALLRRRAISVVAFEEQHFRAAIAAQQAFGKGRGHPARLNFGDCLSYAVAKVHGLPLLFKGDDFALTDAVPAWRP
jgi:ribonuclease VapC